MQTALLFSAFLRVDIRLSVNEPEPGSRTEPGRARCRAGSGPDRPRPRRFGKRPAVEPGCAERLCVSLVSVVLKVPRSRARAFACAGIIITT